MAAISTEAKIVEALNAHLAALALSPPLPIAWTNVPFTPPVDTGGKPKPYLRATFLKNPNVRRATNPNSAHRMSGLYQVDVFHPAAGGEMIAREIAAAIVARFDAGTKLDAGNITVRVDERPTDGSAMIDGMLMQIPVTIRWYVFA